jgi:hypothetical protein
VGPRRERDRESGQTIELERYLPTHASSSAAESLMPAAGPGAWGGSAGAGPSCLVEHDPGDLVRQLPGGELAALHSTATLAFWFGKRTKAR